MWSQTWASKWELSGVLVVSTGAAQVRGFAGGVGGDTAKDEVEASGTIFGWVSVRERSATAALRLIENRSCLCAQLGTRPLVYIADSHGKYLRVGAADAAAAAVCDADLPQCRQLGGCRRGWGGWEPPMVFLEASRGRAHPESRPIWYVARDSMVSCSPLRGQAQRQSRPHENVALCLLCRHAHRS